MNNNELSSTFIISYLIDENGKKSGKPLIEETIEGLFSQTDNDWYAVIVVELLTKQGVYDYLCYLKDKYYPKVDVIFLEQNVGPGVGRNLGGH